MLNFIYFFVIIQKIINFRNNNKGYKYIMNIGIELEYIVGMIFI